MRARPSSFPAWLAAQAAEREERGLTRRLADSDRCFRPPSTPDGLSRLRLTAHAHHTDEELALAAKVLRRVVPRDRR